MKEFSRKFDKKEIEQGKASYGFLNFDNLEQVLQTEVLKMMNGATYTILDFLESSIYWKDTQGRILGCNKYMLKLFGLKKRSEIIGKTDAILISDEMLKFVQDVDQTVVLEEKTIRVEEKVVIASGQEKIFLTIKQPLYDENGKVTGLIGNSIDITDLKQAQEKERIEKKKREDAENAMKEEQAHRKAVSVHSGSMAHDLKNPILANNLANEMNQIVLKKLQEKYQISEEDLRPVFTKMDLIKANNDKMSAMIEASNQMIQDIASEKQVLIQQEFSAYSLIKESLTNYFEEVQSGLIQFDLPQDFKFFTNKIAFLRIMFNLIDNAKRQIKLKNRGKIYISAEQTADFSIIKIKDTAGSVTEDLVKNIFSLYKTKKVQNTGLGLQAVSSLMQSQDGFVHARLVDEKYIEFVLGFKCF